MQKDQKINRTRVLLVDDFEPFRAFVCSVLQQKPALKIVAEVSDGPEAVQKAAELQPDLILLDIGLPTLNGIGAAKQIRQAAPDSKILFLSQETSAEFVQEAINLGALGYVVKTKASSELLIAIEAILQGERFFSSELAGSGHVDKSQRTRW